MENVGGGSVHSPCWSWIQWGFYQWLERPGRGGPAIPV
nr:hypothetical protein Iba_chr05dCG9530 [Ipomoea batatas]